MACSAVGVTNDDEDEDEDEDEGEDDDDDESCRSSCCLSFEGVDAPLAIAAAFRGRLGDARPGDTAGLSVTLRFATECL